MTRVQVRLLRLFNLREDQDTPEEIDQTIRAGAAVGGGNLWGLIGAIFIASIGLNVNSTAVIIGAMLISPLMGPIVGVGYGVGIKDFGLIRLALRNWLIFAFISLVTATTYFAITPLNVAQSELLARTSPNLWDVLIAFIGGGIGMIGATRRQVSNVVPGVAIATALMPPLCTAGFGLATGNWAYFGGALYLFTINSVFIAFASLSVVKLLRLPAHAIARGAHWRTRALIAATVVITAIPSAFLALDLVQQKWFEQSAQRILDAYDEDGATVLLGREVQALNRKVVLTTGNQGSASAQTLRNELLRQFRAQGYEGVEVVVRSIGSEGFDVGQIKQELQKELFQNTVNQLQEATAKVQALEAENKRLMSTQAQHPQLLQELAALLPEASVLMVGAGAQWQRSAQSPQAVQMVSLALDRPVDARVQARLNDWMAARHEGQPLHVEWVAAKAPLAARTKSRALKSSAKSAAASAEPDAKIPVGAATESGQQVCFPAPQAGGATPQALPSAESSLPPPADTAR